MECLHINLVAVAGTGTAGLSSAAVVLFCLAPSDCRTTAGLHVQKCSHRDNMIFYFTLFRIKHPHTNKIFFKYTGKAKRKNKLAFYQSYKGKNRERK